MIETLEEWRPVALTDGSYSASSLGRIRGPRGSILKPIKGSRGYWHVNMTWCGNRKQVSVHRTVALAFLGEPPAGMEASHLDGDSANNAASNLVYETHQENCTRRIEHGTQARTLGEMSGSAKLSEAQVLEVKALGLAGVRHTAIARQFGVSRPLVSLILAGKRWPHLTNQASPA